MNAKVGRFASIWHPIVVSHAVACLLLAATAHPTHSAERRQPNQMGFVDGKCARPQIKPFKTQVSVLKVQAGLVTKVVGAGGKYDRVAGEIVDKDVQSLLAGNKSMVANYNACALPLSQWLEWVDRFSRRMEAAATWRSQLMLDAISARQKNLITSAEYSGLLQSLVEDGDDQLKLLKEVATATRKTGSDETSTNSEGRKDESQTEKKEPAATPPPGGEQGEGGTPGPGGSQTPPPDSLGADSLGTAALKSTNRAAELLKLMLDAGKFGPTKGEESVLAGKLQDELAKQDLERLMK